MLAEGGNGRPRCLERQSGEGLANYRSPRYSGEAFASLDITRAGDPSTHRNIGEAIRMLEVVFVSVARLSLTRTRRTFQTRPSRAVTRHMRLNAAVLAPPAKDNFNSPHHSLTHPPSWRPPPQYRHHASRLARRRSLHAPSRSPSRRSPFHSLRFCTHCGRRHRNGSYCPCC